MAGRHQRLDPETIKAITEYMTEYILDNLRQIEERAIRERHERQRESLKGVLRRYRKLVPISETIVDNAIRAESETKLQDLLDMMNGSGKEAIRLNLVRENAAMIRTMVNHLTNTLESYRIRCEQSSKAEDKRRYRVLSGMYICDEEKTADEIAECENIDRSTVYRDIDNAVEDLAIHFFGILGLDNL